MRRHDDIEQLISEIEHIRMNINDAPLGTAFWEEAMKDFALRHGPELVTLLKMPDGKHPRIQLRTRLIIHSASCQVMHHLIWTVCPLLVKKISLQISLKARQLS